MDHIPCVESHLWRHVRVPFLCEEEYDGLGFADFPTRKGWHDSSDLAPTAIRLSGRSAQEQSSFFQTWLFFGMLAEVLCVPIASHDFVDDGFVTTKRLPKHTFEWYNRLLAMRDDCRRKSLATSERCLLAARVRCFGLLDETQRPDCLVTAEIRLSISILGETLGQIFHSIRHSFEPRGPGGYIDVRNNWGYNRPLLHKLLLEQKHWCQNHVAFLENYLPASTNIGFYYAASLARPRMGYHGNCSAAACVAGLVHDPRAYETKHSDAVDPPCNGGCPQIEPSQTVIHEILQQEGLPLVRASISNHGAVKVEVVKHQEGIKYVAISHVWSDGLGNEDHNLLPECQFVQLIKAVHAAERVCSIRNSSNTISSMTDADSGVTATFWIDTICIPRGQAAARFRRMALDRMSIPYQLASTVLVLDAELCHTELPSTGSEAIFRLICSNWMRRLWTLQEGILGAERLVILFKGGRAFHLWDELEQLRRELWAQPWLLNPLAHFVMRTGIQQSIKALSGSSSKLSWLFRDMNWRSTTRRTDEALVLSNMLDVWPSNMFQIPAEERMRAVIAELPEFPRRVIFAPGRRFRQEGFRWLVYSFLDMANFGLGITVGKIGKKHFPHLGADYSYLEVSYPGYVLKVSSKLVLRPWNFVLRDPVTNQAIHVTSKEKKNQSDPNADQDVDLAETKLPDSSEPDVLLGLVMHHDALATDTIHRYAAIVGLDQTLSEKETTMSSKPLSGRHEGVVDISVSDKGQDLNIEGRLTDDVEIQCGYSQKTWVIR